VLILALLCSPQVGAQSESGDAGNASFARCIACHEAEFEAHEPNPHDILDNDEWQQRTGLAPACTNCHVDAGKHTRMSGSQGETVEFSEDPARVDETCIGCHRDTHPGFAGNPHAAAGLGCSDCHSQHDPAAGSASLLRRTDTDGVAEEFSEVSRICFDCHSDSFTEFSFNERHRLTDGVMECTSCHDPHAPAGGSLLGGFKQQQCMECHSDKGGPFVFEHAVSRVEGCTACHSPHGSPNRHLLMHQRVGELCFTCHASVPQFHSGFSPFGPPRFGLDTQCTNCHATIHGSNLDPYFLR
jgi:DmsE family decaheme c-type cytochrome